MARIVIADDGVSFDGRSPETGPLGGAEAAVVSLAEALAARRHQVEVYNRCTARLTHKGVAWIPIAEGTPSSADLYLANRGHRLIGLVPRARKTLFWIHNPGWYLKKPRYVWALFRRRPVIVCIGDYHAATMPGWMPRGGLEVIPYGLAEEFRHTAPLSSPPPPHAIFTSNPLRGLDWLLDIWGRRIHPALPSAELRIYAGPAVYGEAGGKQAEAMAAVLTRAKSLGSIGVRCAPPLPRAELIKALRESRAMLYRGDENETFCAAVAEAQALGVPVVAQPVGSLPERIVDGVTGDLAVDAESFAASSVALLRDDERWRRMHRAALERQRGRSWDEVAQRFESLIP
ncbi:MAG TPA: glycosyltransferase family 4 protein [Stellaceae bacterium]|nr:glycosyltransferase family 4 protein [Stellaceae bacterium]